MSDILFVTWDGGGNVPPALGIAAELQDRGHRVRFLGHEGNRGQVVDGGFGFIPYATAEPFSCLDSNSPPRMMAMFGERAMGTDLLALVADDPADVVVVDCLLMGALDAARRAGLTYVPLEHLFDEYLRKRWMAGPLGLSGKARGLRPVRALNSAVTNLVASLPELDPATRRRQPANLTYIGPVVSAPDHQDLSARPPAVLVSLSTYNFPGMTASMQQILDACADIRARVIVTTGPVIDPEDLRAPSNAEVHRYVDHDELMPQVSLVIGHGGHATTMRALAHDLPLLIMPMHPMLDQPMVGKAVQRAGAGLRIDKGSGADKIRPLVERLLADGPHRASAARLGAAIRAMPGAELGADAIEALVTSGNGASV